MKDNRKTSKSKAVGKAAFFSKCDRFAYTRKKIKENVSDAKEGKNNG